MYFEDNIFFYETYLKAKRISLIRDFLYYYRINREGSFIKEGNEKFFDICNMHDLLKKILVETGNFDEYLVMFLNYKINGTLGRYNQVDERYKPEFFEIIKQNFIKNNFKRTDIDKLSQTNKIKYQNILISNTYKEYELREEIYQLNNAKQKHGTKYQQLERNYDRLKDKNESYEKEINTQKLFIQKITSSNSWKLTKPLRKIRNLMKR
jgi:hypothetical protein